METAGDGSAELAERRTHLLNAVITGALESTVDEARSVWCVFSLPFQAENLYLCSLGTLVKLTRAPGAQDALRAHVERLIDAFLRAIGDNEPAVLSYLAVRAGKAKD